MEVARRDPSNRCKKSYETNLLTLSARHTQCLSRSALLGRSGSSQKPLVIAEKSGARLKELSRKTTVQFTLLFPLDFEFSGLKKNLECIFGLTSPPSVNFGVTKLLWLKILLHDQN